MTAYPHPAQTDTPLDLMRLPDKAELVKAFVGKPLSSLRTPAIVLDRTRFARNCEAMSASCVRQGITFRAHVKTHKAIEGVRMQLTAGQGCSAVVCSTLMECWQIVREGLVQEGLVKDVSCQPSLGFRQCELGMV
jgi:D-serine deaminase-like pyridoxal phosphate-dependent protein